MTQIASSPPNRLILLICAGILLSACGTTSSITEVDDWSQRSSNRYAEKSATPTSAAKTNEAYRDSRHSDDHSVLVVSMSGWLNTPYKYGGNLKSGIDCSAYVQLLMDKAFESSLPRTTREQLNVGSKISKEELRPGDLVFFKTGRTQYHVGVYLDNGEFTHASTSVGVTVSHLDDYYWRDRFLMGRRVLDRHTISTQRPRRSSPISSSQYDNKTRHEKLSENRMPAPEKTPRKTDVKERTQKSLQMTKKAKVTPKSSAGEQTAIRSWTSDGSNPVVRGKKRIGW